jgi:epoxyqueuosine reductase
MHQQHGIDGALILRRLQDAAQRLGFSQIGVADVDLRAAEPGLLSWLSRGFHGEMLYMAAHGLKRARPAELVPGTVRVITARMNYLPRDTPEGWQAIEFDRLRRPLAAGVSLYARGRDYHKVMRARLQRLADELQDWIGPFGHRVFTDSAPVLEAELAAASGQGWRGKHTLILSRDAGSMFFLGEIFVDVPLPLTPAATAHCGQCRACIDVCPTQAIVGERLVDARRCISYLTIEHPGAIPADFRAAMGNRVYGCDDCQLVCPWNKYAQRSDLPDFDARAGLGEAQLLALWGWREDEFLRCTEGSAIRRIGFERWRRNLAVALGNALRTCAGASEGEEVVRALAAARDGASELVREHIDWALAQARAPEPGRR